MEGNSLIDAVKIGDLAAAEKNLESGVDINMSCERGWTPLSYAAGKGDLEMVKMLVARGADIFKTGRDNRTAYMIALAAGRAEVARYLREVEDATDSAAAMLLRPQRKYCKAYLINELRQFPSWSESGENGKDHKNGLDAGEAGGGIGDEERIVFIHQDFTVTHSMWHNENVIFNQVSPEWKTFCVNTLKFEVPDDMDLITIQEPTGATL